MAQPTSLDASLETCVIQAHADLLLEGHAARRGILEAMHFHALHAAADGRGRHREGVHQEAGVHARAQQPAAIGLGELVQFFGQSGMAQVRPRQLLARADNARTLLEQRLEGRRALRKVGRGRHDHGVNLLEVDAVEVLLHARLVRCTGHHFGELLAHQFRCRINGGHYFANAPRVEVSDDFDAQRAQAYVQDAEHRGAEDSLALFSSQTCKRHDVLALAHHHAARCLHGHGEHGCLTHG